MASSPKGPNVWTQRTFCLITGASRGLGRSMAIRFASLFPAKSFLLLVDREPVGLEETKAVIASQRPDVDVGTWVAELSTIKCEEIEGHLTSVVPNPTQYEQALLVHNAATMGDVSRFLCGHSDANTISEYWRINLTSMVLINSSFWKIFSGEKVKHRVVVQISSIAATNAAKSLSVYCAGKAARDMLMRTMAIEEPSIRVLNYAPGPMNTVMNAEARERVADQKLKELMTASHAQGQLFSPDQAAEGLASLLEKNAFVSGEHVDFAINPVIAGHLKTEESSK